MSLTIRVTLSLPLFLIGWTIGTVAYPLRGIADLFVLAGERVIGEVEPK